MLWLFGFFIALCILVYNRASLAVVLVASAVILGFHHFYAAPSVPLQIGLWSTWLAIAVVFQCRFVRANLFTRVILRMVANHLPEISQTEQEAIAAGTVSWEGELFSGWPNWRRLFDYPQAALTQEEQDFLDGPVEKLCGMVCDWQIAHTDYDIPPEALEYIETHRFFGLIIPPAYGGLGFSARAHAAILVKLYSRSPTLGTIVAVPNSLGPAELLLHYGTDAQKNYYLPRLACGVEVPCFALTSNHAGSDAGGIVDTGVVCRGEWDGEEILGIRLNFDKRYITLAPVATLIGLAFKLYDPDKLLGEEVDIGITCALLPRDTEGLDIGKRHMPLAAPFPNGPVRGKDIFVPFDYVIGGKDRVGQGWRMLVECLSCGRAISLPASAIAGAKVAAYSTGAYSRIRKQFNVPIGYFEGVAEPLARIIAHTYLMDSVSMLTTTIIDEGEKPAILSAIVKYHVTEMGRNVAIDAMDIHGGKGICLGPNNYLAPFYQNAPIGITVEGANILTRSLIIFGQGALRCHPHILHEVEALQMKDPKKRLYAFDKALFAHACYFMSNVLRAFWQGIISSRLTLAPVGKARRYYQLFSRASAAFALTSDVALLTLGGSLKRREKLSGRFADILSCLYMGSAALKRFEDDGQLGTDLPIIHYICRELLYQYQQQLDAILRNLPNRPLAWFVRFMVFPFGKPCLPPHDKLDKQLAKLAMYPSDVRDRIAHGIYIGDEDAPLHKLTNVLADVIVADELEKRLAKAIRNQEVPPFGFYEQVDAAVEADIFTQEEGARLVRAYEGRLSVVKVDEFGHLREATTAPETAPSSENRQD